MANRVIVVRVVFALMSLFIITAARGADTLPPPVSDPDDWPGWRGAHQDGIAVGRPTPTRWSETENITWKVRIPGHGHSSPIVIGDQIFLATADDRQQVQAVIAVDRKRGKLLWQTDIHEGNFEEAIHRENSHASGTLGWDGERLYVLFLNHRRIWCSALSPEGEELWRADVGGFRSRFGYSGSPAIHGDFVICAADHEDGGFIAALRRDTGDLVWRRKRPTNASYASPRVVKLGSKELVVLSGCDRVIAYDPKTGSEVWSVAGTTQSTVGTAVVADDLVIVSGGFPGAETLALRADGKVAWRNKDKTYVPSMIVVDGSLYTMQDDGIARCWDAKTGKPLWQQRVGGKFRASPVCADGLLYITDMAGKTTVFQANPQKFELVAQNQLGNEGFASFAVSRGQLFLRVADDVQGSRVETLYCIDSGAAAPRRNARE